MEMPAVFCKRLLSYLKAILYYMLLFVENLLTPTPLMKTTQKTRQIVCSLAASRGKQTTMRSTAVGKQTTVGHGVHLIMITMDKFGMNVTLITQERILTLKDRYDALFVTSIKLEKLG